MHVNELTCFINVKISAHLNFGIRNLNLNFEIPSLKINFITVLLISVSFIEPNKWKEHLWQQIVTDYTLDTDVLKIGVDTEGQIARQRPRSRGPSNKANIRLVLKRETDDNFSKR